MWNFRVMMGATGLSDGSRVMPLAKVGVHKIKLVLPESEEVRYFVAAGRHPLSSGFGGRVVIAERNLRNDFWRRQTRAWRARVMKLEPIGISEKAAKFVGYKLSLKKNEIVRVYKIGVINL